MFPRPGVCGFTTAFPPFGNCRDDMFRRGLLWTELKRFILFRHTTSRNPFYFVEGSAWRQLRPMFCGGPVLTGLDFLNCSFSREKYDEQFFGCSAFVLLFK